MKVFQNRAVAAVLMVLAIAASVAIGQARKPDLSVEPSTKVVGSYTYTYDEAGILSDKTMEHIDAMNASLFAQTGAQIMVKTVNSTNGQDILEYAIDLGNQYGVGDAERNNGVVMVLALDNISASGLQGDYGVVVGDGLTDYGNAFSSMQYEYLEDDFAAGSYDAGVKKTMDAFFDWFADYYNVSIRENYIPAVSHNYSTASGYHTETTGYVERSAGSIVGSFVTLILVLLVIWMILDAMRWSRYRRRYLQPGMGIPTVWYRPVFWGHSWYRPRPPRRPPPPRGGGRGPGGPRPPWAAGVPIRRAAVPGPLRPEAAAPSGAAVVPSVGAAASAVPAVPPAVAGGASAEAAVSGVPGAGPSAGAGAALAAAGALAVPAAEAASGAAGAAASPAAGDKRPKANTSYERGRPEGRPLFATIGRTAGMIG